MKYKKYNLIFAIAALLSAPTVYAAPNDLVVEFQNTPLFNEANFLPGDSVTRSVKVTNNTSESKSIITEAINDIDINNLGDAFNFQVKEGSTVLFSGALSEFFDKGEVLLSSVGASATAQYDFIATFDIASGNPYQEKSLGFDILIGFKGGESVGSSPPDSGSSSGGGGGNSGGGGGGGGIPRGLVIQNETLAEVTDTTATIVWNTSFQSTSRVVYGTVPGVFNFSLPPNYGYPFSTDEFNTPANPNGVTSHSVTLSGLMPGTTFYFRTISHASPDTISKEISFTTMQTGSNSVSDMLSPGPNVSAPFENAPVSQTFVSGNEISQIQNGITAPTAQEPSSDEVSQNTDDNNTGLLAAALFGFGNINIWRWSFLLFILLLIAYWIYRRYKLDK